MPPCSPFAFWLRWLRPNPSACLTRFSTDVTTYRPAEWMFSDISNGRPCELPADDFERGRFGFCVQRFGIATSMIVDSARQAAAGHPSPLPA
jgi:hypothetical protein